MSAEEYDRRVLRRLSVLTLMALALLVAGCGGGEDEGATSEATPAPTAASGSGEQQASAGRDTFVSACGACHTMSDAGTNGQIGPNLDTLEPDAETVLTAIQTGPGQMPANLVEGEQAQQVAEYVAANSGE